MINNTLNKNKNQQVQSLENFKQKFLGVQNKTPFQPPVQNKTSFQPAPTQSKPQTGLVSSAPKTTSTSSNLGTYKGVSINPGTQEQIQAQMKSIDTPITPATPSPLAMNTQTTPKVTTPTTTAPAPKVSGLFPDVVSSLAERGKTTSEAVTQAQKDFAQASENLRKFKESTADASAGIKSDPVSARVMQGREAALQQANAEKLAAYQEAVTQAQTGIELGQAQQGLEQQALQQAGALASPVQIAPGSTLAAPIGGETIAGGLGGYANYQTAEQVMGLISQYPDANYIYNSDLTPQQNLQNAQSAIQRSPTYQRSTFGVPGQQSVAGATQVQAAQQGYTQSLQDYNTLQSNFQNADMLADNVLNIMQEGGINPTDARYANQTVQQVKRQLSSEQQQKFDTALLEARNAFGRILVSGGGTPTGAEDAYQTLLNPSASVGAITAAIGELKNAGNVRLNAEYQRVQGYYNQLQSPTTQSSGGGAFSW